MKNNHALRMIFGTVLAGCGLAGATGWKQPEFIITRWCSPPATDENLRLLVRDGYTLTTVSPAGDAAVPADESVKLLDCAQRNGIKSLLCHPLISPGTLDDPTQKAKLVNVTGGQFVAGMFKQQWSFTPGGWNPKDWILVKSPRWAYFGQWVQKPDHIENRVPIAATPEEWQGKRASETYTSMVYKHPFAGDVRVTTTTGFTPRMAPIIVIAPELGQDALGRPEYREHFEVCIYNEGVNLWHHTFTDGKPAWRLAANAKFVLKPETPYLLDVEIKEKEIVIRIDGHEIRCQDTSIPAKFFVGITGCEGRNQFYDLSITGRPAAD